MTRLILAASLLAISARAEAPPGWGFPGEVAVAKGERDPWPVEVVRGASGAVGVFVFEADAGTTLHLAPGPHGPWKAIFLPNGPPGEPVVDGDRVEVVLADTDAGTFCFASIDLATAKESPRVPIPGKFRGTPSFSRLVADGPSRSALVALEEGPVLFSRSADAGRTWTPLAEVARPGGHGNAPCPPLFSGEKALHVVFVDDEARIVHRRSEDAGATWKDAAAVPKPPEEHGAPRAAAGAQAGGLFHLCVLTDKARFAYTWSDDEGAHWGPWSVLASPAREAAGEGGLAATFRLKARGKMAALAWTERGDHDGDPLHARLLVSRTSGSRWESTDPGGGVKGWTGLPTVFLGDDGGLTAAFAAMPGALRGKKYVLARAFGKAADPEPATRPEWWGK